MKADKIGLWILNKITFQMISINAPAHFLFIIKIVEFNDALLTFSCMLMLQEIQEIEEWSHVLLWFVTFVNSSINLGGDPQPCRNHVGGLCVIKTFACLGHGKKRLSGEGCVWGTLVERELGKERNGHFTNANGGKSLAYSFFKPCCLFNTTVTDFYCETGRFVA